MWATAGGEVVQWRQGCQRQCGGASTGTVEWRLVCPKEALPVAVRGTSKGTWRRGGLGGGGGRRVAGGGDVTVKACNIMVVWWSRWWHSPRGVSGGGTTETVVAGTRGARSDSVTTKMGGSAAGDSGAATKAVSWQSFGE